MVCCFFFSCRVSFAFLFCFVLFCLASFLRFRLFVWPPFPPRSFSPAFLLSLGGGRVVWWLPRTPPCPIGKTRAACPLQSRHSGQKAVQYTESPRQSWRMLRGRSAGGTERLAAGATLRRADGGERKRAKRRAGGHGAWARMGSGIAWRAGGQSRPRCGSVAIRGHRILCPLLRSGVPIRLGFRFSAQRSSDGGAWGGPARQRRDPTP